MDYNPDSPVPDGKARYDCECGNIHYGSAKAKHIFCPRCGCEINRDNRACDIPLRGQRVDPIRYEDE